MSCRWSANSHYRSPLIDDQIVLADLPLEYSKLAKSNTLSLTDPLILANYQRFAEKIWPSIDWAKLIAPQSNGSTPSKRQDHQNGDRFRPADN